MIQTKQMLFSFRKKLGRKKIKLTDTIVGRTTATNGIGVGVEFWEYIEYVESAIIIVTNANVIIKNKLKQVF